MSYKLNKLIKRVQFLEKEISNVKKEISNITIKDKKQINNRKKLESKQVEIKSKAKRDYEFSIGGYIIGIIGAVAVLIACGWFVKLAIERRWLNESARIILGILLGFSIIILSWFLVKKKFKILPNIVFGTGYAILYIILFSAYNFYELLNINETFIYLFTLSIVSTFISKISKSQVLYIFSITGAFLAPILVSQGENSYRFLFSYLTVLNLIFLYMSFKFRWKTSAYLLLGFNTVIYLIWAVGNITESSFVIPFLFVSTLFQILMIRYFFLNQKEESVHIADHLLLIFNVIVYISLGHYTLDNFYPNLISHFYLVSSLFLILWYFLSRKINNNILDRINLGVFFLITIIPLFFVAGTYFFDGPWIITILILFSGILSIIGVFLKKYGYLIASIPFWIIALISIWTYDLGNTDILLIFNNRFYLYILSFIFLGLTFILQPENKKIWIFGFAALFMIIIGSLLENSDIFMDNHHLRRLSYSYIILAYAIILFFPGFIKSKRVLRLTGLVLIGIVILKFYLYDIWVFSTIIRIIAGFSLGGLFIIMAIFYQKLKERIINK